MTAFYRLVLIGLCLALISGCQGENYDVVVLKSQVRELQSELKRLRDIADATNIESLQRRVVQLESDLIAVQQQMTTLQERQAATTIDGSRSPESLDSFVLETPDPQPKPPAAADESGNQPAAEEAARALESAGAILTRDESGQVIAVDASEFPMELATIQRLRDLPDIRQLAVSGPWVSAEMFDVFGQLSSLERIDLDVTIANTELLARLSGLARLRYIQLFRTDIDNDSLAVLAKFPELEQIRCGQTRVGDAGLEHLRSMTRLRAIDLSDCNSVSSAGVEALSGLPNLKFLKVWGPQINDRTLDSIAQMSSLEVLGLNDTRVTDAGIEKLAGLTSLQEIHLVRTRTGDRSLEIFSALPNVATLRLRDTQLSDAGLEYLARIKGLERLDLSENSSPGITDAGMQSVGRMENLVELNLWTTQVSDEGIHSLVNLGNLRWLNLDKTLVTDAACQTLAQMPQLEWLHLGSNNLTDAAVQPLLKLPNLRYLNLKQTGISQDAWFEIDDVVSQRGGIVVPP